MIHAARKTILTAIFLLVSAATIFSLRNSAAQEGKPPALPLRRRRRTT